MKLVKIYFVILLGILSICLGYGDGVNTDFAQTIKQAINSSPQYKYIGYQLDSRDMQPKIQLGELLPHINATGSLDSNSTLASNQEQTDKGISVNVNLTQALYDYGAFKNFQSAGKSAEFAKQDYRSQYQQFLYDVSYAYFNLAKTIKNVEYNSYNLKAAKISFDQLEKEYKAGTANAADYETAKSNYYIANAEFVSAQQQEKVARASLQKFTNNTDNIQLYSNDFQLKNPPLGSEESWEQLAMISNPNYLGSIYTKEGKYYDYQSITGNFMPKVNFEMNYSSGNTDSKGSVNDFYFGINFEWNFLSGGTDFAKLKQAAYNYQSSEFDMIQDGRVAKNDAMYSYRFVEQTKNQILALRESAKSSKIAYEKYKDKYYQGTTTITQYFIQLNNYYQYLITLNNDEFNYILGFLSLYKTAGILTPQVIDKFNNWLLFGEKIKL